MTVKYKMKTEIKADDILIILYWVNTFFSYENKVFTYQNLLDQAETYQLTNTPFDVNIHPIDELMIDAHKVYHKFKETEKQLYDILDMINTLSIKKEVIKEQVDRFFNIFDDLIENYRYEDPEIRGIQKGVLTEKMKKYVADEEYELAAKLRDIINEC